MRPFSSMTSDAMIVIPAYNEESTVGDVVRMASQFGTVCVVDDGSTDATARIARKLSHCYCK